ncbi:IDEAL domain-containing protein [Metabacillus rhizolycopersici]|jgi:uncharacterized protein YpiB (UPF0302 family)|uniref:IDEAL domain-containing protein n=1 Tax=Metabacillus rhizolycopersici TaxID=2875709 RepID=A0ABS7UR65_9BACI|nr:IDEAL domain-containing protein [Metabacillus rhizolycopersici]MBZ5750796.1 IDEAL domain-containing protein [Metabacillus rhizolycopersici]
MGKFLRSASQQPKVDTETVNSLYVEMVLDKVSRDYRKDQILKEIDRSLKDRNKQEFLRLTEELKSYITT